MKLDEAASRLREAGVDSPRLAAEILLAHAAGVDRARVYDVSDAPGFDALVADAARRVPIAYLTGTKESYGLPMRVGPGVFIPRPCTDGLIELALERPFRRALDVGTGSGNIAAALAYHRPEAFIVAVDISRDALRWARRNTRVPLVRGDLLEWTRGPFDLIVSNPPYVESPDDVAPEVRHEPDVALYGGLTAIRRIAASVPMAPGGRLLLEFGFGQADDVRRIFPRAETHNDLEGIPRYAVCCF